MSLSLRRKAFSQGSWESENSGKYMRYEWEVRQNALLFLFVQELYMANLFFCSLYTKDFTVSLTWLVSQCSFYMADGADKETVKSCFLVSRE